MEGEERAENKVSIEGLDGVYMHAEAIRAGLRSYLGDEGSNVREEPASQEEQ